MADKLLTPRRLDIVAYRARNTDPRQPSKEVVYCKRLIGLPGETLVFDGSGGITVNGQPITLPSAMAGKLHASLDPVRIAGKYTDGEPITLGPDEIFVIGDNVGLSSDSRVHGPSKISDIVGVVDLMYWPLNRVSVMR